MGQRCGICKHDNRLEIDRAIMKGMPYLRIGKKYGVNDVSVANHARKHLSRQLLKSGEMKEVIHSKNLFQEVEGLIGRTKNILNDAEKQGRPMISLNAIRELRKTFEFLIKFSAFMQEAQKVDEKDKWDEIRFAVKIIKERLSVDEISLLHKLMSKMNGEIDSDEDLLQDIRKTRVS